MSNNIKPIRILHVEDERGALEITRLFLERKGYNNFKITQASSAEHGLEKLEKENFDVIISDYIMPGMNGLEFLEELRKKGKGIPFIIFTGKGEEKVAIEAINKGANRYIKKEGNPNVLFDTLGQSIQEVIEERTKELDARNKKQPLILALEDKDWNVRMGAAEALGKIGDTRAVEPLMQTLKDGKRGARRSAAEALGKIKEPAIEPLIQAMKDESEYVRLGAVEALGEIGDAIAIEPLIQALEDENLDIRWSTAEALEKMGELAIKPLIQTLKKNEDKDIRGSAAEVLGEIGNTRAVEPLIHALNDKESADVRRGAAGALGKIGDARAIEPLVWALKDRAWNVRKTAAEALVKIGEPAIEPLIPILRDKDADVRKLAVEVLGKIGDKRAVRSLIQALKDKKEGVRKSVAEALGKIGEPALEPLIPALKDEEESIRKSAAEALGKIGDKRAIEPLIQAWKGENEDVRKVVEKAVEKIRKSNDESLARHRTLRHIEKDRTIPPRGIPKKEEKVKRHEEEVILNPRQIKEIRDLHARGYRDSGIARRMGISQKSVTKYLEEERKRRVEETYLHSHRIKI